MFRPTGENSSDRSAPVSVTGSGWQRGCAFLGCGRRFSDVDRLVIMPFEGMGLANPLGFRDRDQDGPKCFLDTRSLVCYNRGWRATARLPLFDNLSIYLSGPLRRAGN
jgi:hypothetical protein